MQRNMRITQDQRGTSRQTAPPPAHRPPDHSSPGATNPIPGQNTTNHGNTLKNKRPKKWRPKVSIKIASQNLNGAAAPSENMTFLNKWKKISDTMHMEKITILVVQETHLDQNMLEQIQTTFKKNLTIIASSHPTNPRAKAGVAFMINKKLINPDEITTHELIPGRALMLKIKWLGKCSATILNVYTPNQRNKHTHF